LYLYRTRIVCYWIIYGYMYAPMIHSFVYRALVSCIVRSFRVSCIHFVYRAFVSCIVRSFRVLCVFCIVGVKRLFVCRTIHERMNHWSVHVTIYYPITNDPGSIEVQYSIVLLFEWLLRKSTWLTNLIFYTHWYNMDI
jgi:hypothetical protein